MAASALIFWNEEKSWTVRSVSSVVEPRKRYGEVYRRGDIVKAKYSGGIYPGVILHVSDNKDELKSMVKLLEDFMNMKGPDAGTQEILTYLEERELGTTITTPAEKGKEKKKQQPSSQGTATPAVKAKEKEKEQPLGKGGRTTVTSVDTEEETLSATELKKLQHEASSVATEAILRKRNSAHTVTTAEVCPAPSPSATIPNQAPPVICRPEPIYTSIQSNSVRHIPTPSPSIYQYPTYDHLSYPVACNQPTGPTGNLNEESTSSMMMGDAYSTIYGSSYQDDVYMAERAAEPHCRSCCLGLQQLKEDMEQLRGEVDQLRRKRKQSNGSPEEMLQQEIMYNGHTKSYLEEIVNTSSSLFQGVKRLFSALFTTDEIVHQSVMGRHTNKRFPRKTGLDDERRNLMEGLLVTKFNKSINEVRNKMRDRQKVVQRAHKGLSSPL